MGLSIRNSKPEKIFCPIRQKWVAALPEEIIRHKLIFRMINELGFPIGGLGVEKELRQMPHLALYQKSIPERRADLVSFAPKIHPQYPLYPLILIECKAIPLSSKVINQVIGYNYFVGAPFIAIANESEIRVGWRQASGYEFVPYLPFYQDLILKISKTT